MDRIRAIGLDSRWNGWLSRLVLVAYCTLAVLILLRASPGAYAQNIVCAKEDTSKECDARKETAVLLSAGETFLHLPQPNYSRARTSCESALAIANNPAQQRSAAGCIQQANLSIHEIQHHDIDLSLRDIDTQLWRKDFTQAAALSDALRKQYAGWPIEQDGPNEYITDQLQRRPGQGTKHPVVLPLLKSTGRWILTGVSYLVRALTYLLYAAAIVLVLVSVVVGVRKRRSDHRTSCETEDQLAGKTSWRVWNITDEGKTGAAGAIMEALKIGNNTLLRDHYNGQFVPPSLVLSPLPLSEQQPAQTTAVWWNFLGGRSRRCSIEVLPITAMGRHSFSFEEALDDIDLKVAGTDVKGVFSAHRSIRRWFYQGYPELQATVGSSGKDEKLVSTVRLTCNYKHDWGAKTKGNLTPQANQSLSADIQTNTISVLASTEQQKYADPIGLAAHRAAFKLFYRLAEPKTHPDHIGAVAAFFQGITLLLLLL